MVTLVPVEPALAAISAKPGEDGAPADSDDEAAAEELNDAIHEGPRDGQSMDEWFEEIDVLQQELNEPAPSCRKYTIRSGECPLEGDALTCGRPCVFPTSSCDIGDLPSAIGLYDIIDDVDSRTERVSDDELALVRSGWAVLLENLDLVRWTSCLSYGESTVDSSVWENLGGLFGIAGSVAECLDDKIQGLNPDVTIRFTRGLPKGSFATESNALTGGTISIPKTGGTWNTKYVDKFVGAHDAAAQFCIASDLAATLLHELVHSCLTGGSRDTPVPGDAPNTCSTSYVIENLFRHALGQRYTCLGSTPDCSYYTDSRLWANDGVSYPATPPW